MHPEAGWTRLQLSRSWRHDENGDKGRSGISKSSHSQNHTSDVETCQHLQVSIYYQTPKIRSRVNHAVSQSSQCRLARTLSSGSCSNCCRQDRQHMGGQRQLQGHRRDHHIRQLQQVLLWLVELASHNAVHSSPPYLWPRMCNHCSDHDIS